MTNTSPFSIANTQSTVDVGTPDTYNNLISTGSHNVHKALDFSNVAMYSTGSSDRHLRQFHQTRLYISGFGGMLGHGALAGAGTYLISANLPEAVSYKIGSEWAKPLSAFGSPLVNALMQVGSNALSTHGGPNGEKVASSVASGVNRATTLKVWNGAEELKLSLKIPVLDDGHSNLASASGVNTNLVEALEFLGSLVLPKKGGTLGFYTPPPSPLNLKIKYGKDSEESTTITGSRGRIMLQLGGMLLVDNCIIESVEVEYPNTKALIRHNYSRNIAPGQVGTDYLTPLLAMVTINVSTIEAMTANTYSNMLWLKHQETEGEGALDINEASEYLKAAGNLAADVGINAYNLAKDTLLGKGETSTTQGGTDGKTSIF